nr:MAG TPA: Golgin subfamily A member 5 [Caudoviricetes sp.]
MVSCNLYIFVHIFVVTILYRVSPISYAKWLKL